MFSYVQKPPTAEEIQTSTRIPAKIVVALFSGILVNSGILVEAVTPLRQPYKVDLFSTTCVSRLVQPLHPPPRVFSLSFVKKLGILKNLLNFLAKKIEKKNLQ